MPLGLTPLGMVNSLKNEIYDPDKDVWEELMDTPADFGHIHRSVAIIDDVAYLIGIVEFTAQTGEKILVTLTLAACT